MFEPVYDWEKWFNIKPCKIDKDGTHYFDQVFEIGRGPPIDEERIEYSIRCAVCHKILHGPHEVGIELIELINDLSVLI